MSLPEYVSVREVRRVCKELGLRDWTELSVSKVRLDEASTILAAMNVEGMDIDPEVFREGLEVELEHGLRYKDANVTSNHPVLTGKIVLAHLKESFDYYKRLQVAEIEGDFLKTLGKGNAARIEELYRGLVEARLRLSRSEAETLGGKG
jgi:hypothetical protein